MVRARPKARPGRVLPALLVGGLAGVAAPASAQGSLDPRPSVNLYGQPGLIDTPSAEMMPDAEVTGSWAWFPGTKRRNLAFQILPRVSGTVRFATLANWGRPDEPGFDLPDRSFDVTFQLVREEGWRPAVALGFRDIFDTGVYGSEFLVVSKRVLPGVTLSAGIGWGRLGGDARGAEAGDGGSLATGRFFSGGADVFGGVEWRTPLRGLTLKAEYSPDPYTGEQRSPASDFARARGVNLGAEYRLTSGITLGGYWLYGDAVGVNVSITANPNRPIVPQNLAPGPIPVAARAADAPRGTGWAADPAAREQLGTALAAVLAAEGLRLEELRVTPDLAEVRVVNRRIARDPQAIGRTVRVLQTGMPASVGTFRVTLVRDGLPVTSVTIDRATYEGLIDRPLAGERMWEAARVESAAAGPAPEGVGVWRPGRYPTLAWTVAPVPWFVYTGRDDPARVGLTADAAASVEFAPGVSLNAAISQPLLGRSADPGPVDTDLQPVRTSRARYFAGRAPNLTRLSADWIGKAAPDLYVRTSAGYLERQFAGVSTEILWKPSEQSWGVGAELNYVAQRDRDGGFGFGDYDYEVATGHASFYWDTGWNGFEVQLDAGRYLAGDWGSTLRLTRRFENGWVLGAFATLTDVSRSEFGEGGFDRGVILEIPLKWAAPFETRARIPLEIRTVTRDGGARLAIANRLYPTVRALDAPRLERGFGSFWQ